VIALAEIEAARERIRGTAVRTPLVRLYLPESPLELYLKLECLQPIASFKLRGAGNAIALLSDGELAKGVVTASAGNMAQGVAWAARERGVPCTVIVPDHAPETKLAAIARLGGRVIRVPYDQWWQTIVDCRSDLAPGPFIHPVQDPAVMAGNGTIGLELLEDLPDPDLVLVPYGGGGLVSGIGSVIKARRPEARVIAVEPETGAGLSGAIAAGHPVTVEYTPSFVDGSGSRGVLESMWPIVREIVDGSVTVSVAETAHAVRLLAERARVVSEGAGALALAAALSGRVGEARKVVCIVSGGNIDSDKLAACLRGETP
jgi:threonine dehydratase